MLGLAGPVITTVKAILILDLQGMALMIGVLHQVVMTGVLTIKVGRR